MYLHKSLYLIIKLIFFPPYLILLVPLLHHFINLCLKYKLFPSQFSTPIIPVVLSPSQLDLAKMWEIDRQEQFIELLSMAQSQNAGHLLSPYQFVSQYFASNVVNCSIRLCTYHNFSALIIFLQTKILLLKRDEINNGLCFASSWRTLDQVYPFLLREYILNGRKLRPISICSDRIKYFVANQIASSFSFLLASATNFRFSNYLLDQRKIGRTQNSFVLSNRGDNRIQVHEEIFVMLQLLVIFFLFIVIEKILFLRIPYFKRIQSFYQNIFSLIILPNEAQSGFTNLCYEVVSLEWQRAGHNSQTFPLDERLLQIVVIASVGSFQNDFLLVVTTLLIKDQMLGELNFYLSLIDLLVFLFHSSIHISYYFKFNQLPQYVLVSCSTNKSIIDSNISFRKTIFSTLSDCILKDEFLYIKLLFEVEVYFTHFEQGTIFTCLNQIRICWFLWIFRRI